MASHSPLQLKVAQGCSSILEASYFLYPLEMKDCNGKSLINGAFEQEHHLQKVPVIQYRDPHEPLVDSSE